jgi:hypothetical protein
MTNEFGFIDRVVVAADTKRSENGESALSTAERVASTIWDAYGIIGNGSFQYFFECSLDAESCAQAYDAIGFPEGSRIFRLALSLFPDSRPHQDVGERVAYVQGREEVFDNLGMEILRLEPAMMEHLAAYLRKAGFNDHSEA